jgi:hypothetical protein
MDHNDAVRLQAAEKYLLHEMPSAQRDEYEEHYFDCPACAEELKATVAFMESSRQAFREEALQIIENKKLVPTTGGWFARLRPAVAIPIFAGILLVAFSGYQNLVTMPNLKKSEALALSASAYKSFSLPDWGSRGQDELYKISVRPNDGFGLDANMPGTSPKGYYCQIQDQSGRVRFARVVSPEEDKHDLHFHFPAGSLGPGKYSFVVFEGQTPPPPPAPGKSVSVAGQLSFVVEFIE